jgi:hypothetical protein
VGQLKGERNFHIFYQVRQGLVLPVDSFSAQVSEQYGVFVRFGNDSSELRCCGWPLQWRASIMASPQ